MKSVCVITIKLNTLTDIPYEMMVGGTFVYVCERDRVKGFLYITRFVITLFFPVDPDRVIMELQCSILTNTIKSLKASMSI